MKNATYTMTVAVGALMGLGGIEHGIGEILQGNTAPTGIMILSWPETPFFRILGGEPAMTIIPNLLVTGILAILSSLIFLIWTTRFVRKENGGPVLVLLSIIMLLVGGGIAPPLIGTILGASVTISRTPLTWPRAHLSADILHWLGRPWRWFLSICISALLFLLPGSGILAYFFGVNNPGLIYFAISLAFGSLLLSILSGFASDIRSELSVRTTTITRPWLEEPAGHQEEPCH